MPGVTGCQSVGGDNARLPPPSDVLGDTWLVSALVEVEVEQLIARDRDRKIHGGNVVLPPLVLTQRGNAQGSRILIQPCGCFR